jgi:1-acyl-sn-glycerol-3-phosphate acyltransferase
MKRETLQNFVGFLFRTFTRTEYIGCENIPAQGGVIVATNHCSRVDTLLLWGTPSRPDITALVADKYQKYPLFNWVLGVASIIWLDRSQADFGAFRVAADAIKKGACLGIAPEGTRSRNGQLLPGKPGTALLALRTNAPIVPVGIAGTDQAVRGIFTLQRPHLYLRFGTAFHLPPLERDKRSEQMQLYTDEIMCRIAALLPESQRGAYRDHPMLKKIMNAQAVENSSPK